MRRTCLTETVKAGMAQDMAEPGVTRRELLAPDALGGTKVGEALLRGVAQFAQPRFGLSYPIAAGAAEGFDADIARPPVQGDCSGAIAARRGDVG